MKRKRIMKIVGVVVVAWLILTQSTGIGDVVIGLFAIAAIIRGIDARWSFGVALVFLASIPLLSLINQTALGDTYAVYAFYFLVIGVITSMAELRREEAVERPYAVAPAPARRPSMTVPAPSQPAPVARRAGMGREITRRPRTDIRK